MTEKPSQSRPRQAPSELPHFLRPLRSLLVAILDAYGTLMDANRGFRALLPEEWVSSDQSALTRILQNPTLPELLEGIEECGDAGPVFSGLMTFGTPDGESESWLGAVYRQDDFLLLIAERDVDEDRRLQRQLLRLTEGYAEQERQLTRANRELARYAEEVERLTLTDPLTELPNRRHFDAFLRQELEKVVRYQEPLSLLLLDLDHFKAINDTHGHLQGDEVLRRVANTLAAHIRGADAVARWGGEEFAVLAPKIALSAALELAERLRQAVSETELPQGIPAVTASIGVAEWVSGESAEGLLARVDRALYRAKETGRNRVSPTAPPPPGKPNGGK